MRPHSGREFENGNSLISPAALFCCCVVDVGVVGVAGVVASVAWPLRLPLGTRKGPPNTIVV